MAIPVNITMMPIRKVSLNPQNPRTIKDASFHRLVKSLKESPELFMARPLLCSDRTGQLVVIGGNMRLLAARELKYREVPVIVMHGLDERREREIAIKDNGDFGEWDFDALANEWTDCPLAEWGINLPEDWTKQRQTEEIEYTEKDIRPYKKTHILLSFEPEKITLIKGQLEEILKIDGIEYEQGSN